MKYIGIVNEIKEDHKSGIYGKKGISKGKLNKLLNEGVNFLVEDKDNIVKFLSPPSYLVAKMYSSLREGKNSGIRLQSPIETPHKILIFQKDSIGNNYSIGGNNEFLYGLFDVFSNPSKAFENILKSNGGSSLSIVEREHISKKYQHLNNGIFSEGLYVIHPKNEKILIPLKGMGNMIETLMLEETISAYEALGAKRILIEDLIDIRVSATGKKREISGGVEGGYKKETLREKVFGKGVFSPERALTNKYFIQDIPAVMTTINARIEGNQLSETFVETINIDFGVGVDVLGLYGGETNFSSSKKWKFHVEFYDKNEF